MPSTIHFLRDSPAQLAAVSGSDWRNHAVCARHPRLPAATWDDVMAGEEGRQGAGFREQRIKLAKSVCRRECPVRQACLDAVDLDLDEGVRGGEDLRDVRAARRGEQHA